MSIGYGRVVDSCILVVPDLFGVENACKPSPVAVVFVPTVCGVPQAPGFQSFQKKAREASKDGLPLPRPALRQWGVVVHIQFDSVMVAKMWSDWCGTRNAPYRVLVQSGANQSCGCEGPSIVMQIAYAVLNRAASQMQRI